MEPSFDGIGDTLEAFLRADPLTDASSFRFHLDSLARVGDQLFAAWYSDVIPRLRSATQANPPVAEASGVRKPPLQEHWIQLGFLAAYLGRTRLAFDTYFAMLEECRLFQREGPRVHKGTPYHQLGWTLLAQTDPQRDEARDYFLLAAIEDVLSGWTVDEPPKPALRVLQSEFAIAPTRVQEWVSELLASTAVNNERLLEQARRNPELLTLVHRLSRQGSTL